jgi:hypothetical protein
MKQFLLPALITKVLAEWVGIGKCARIIVILPDIINLYSIECSIIFSEPKVNKFKHNKKNERQSFPVGRFTFASLNFG